VVWQADFKPFGEVDITVEDVENNFRFSGQYYDDETGLHYNLHRYYDPKTGRYLRPDPIGLAGMDPNLYGYVLNNPVNAIDPLGLHGIILFGRGPWYVNIPRNLRAPFRHSPRNLPKQQPYQPRYVPKPTPDLTPKGNWLSRFLKDLADWLDELGLGGMGSVTTDPCEKYRRSAPYDGDELKGFYHPVYNPGGLI
jgi:RHS repeat-associated protein